MFNATGASLTMNANFLNAMSVASDIIWNFVDATSVTFNTQWGGIALFGLGLLATGWIRRRAVAGRA